MLNLALMLEDTARRMPDRDAIVVGDTRLKYATVNAAANQIANLLADCGVRPGDRVALSCGNVPFFPIIYFGILKAGAAVVPLNTQLKSTEIAYHLADSGAKAYFCYEGGPDFPLGEQGWAAFQEVDQCDHFFLITSDPPSWVPIGGPVPLRAALAGRSTRFQTAATSPTDTAVILYTSGTTGQPKGAELSHANMVLNATTCHRLFGAMDHHVHLVALPLFHAFSQTVQMNFGFGAGGTLVLVPRFAPEMVLATMHRERVTFFAGVPTMDRGLLTVDLSPIDREIVARNLQVAVSGGAALPEAVFKQVHRAFGIEIREGYGLSETSPVVTFNHPERAARPGSIGQPVWGVEIKLIDDEWRDVPDGEVGEIAIRGHNVMKGYLGRHEATTKVLRDGWFRTGDIGRRDEDDYYYVVDRASDLIIRGGYNVYSRELEEVIMMHPAVSLAAVVGVPHARHGEEVKAFVIPKPGMQLTDADLIGWCRDKVAGNRYPRIVELCDTLPTNAAGKILKRKLRERHGANSLRY
jgi:long-chain acyl-CoA synthetase